MLKLFFVGDKRHNEDGNYQFSLDLFITADTRETAVVLWKLWVAHTMEIELPPDANPQVFVVPPLAPHPRVHCWHDVDDGFGVVDENAWPLNTSPLDEVSTNNNPIAVT